MDSTQALLRAALLVGLLYLAAASAGWADEDDDAAAVAPAVDFDVLDLLRRTRNELSAYTDGPPVAGHDDALVPIWKTHLKSRLPRMLRRLKELASVRRYVMDAEGELALRLKEEAWSGTIQRATALYAELESCRAGYDDLRVSPDKAIRVWHRAHPAPDLSKPTPSEARFAQLGTQIARLLRSGEVVPGWMYRERDDLAEAAVHERAALEARHAAWERAEADAIEAVHTAVAATRAAAEVEQQKLALHKDNLRAFVAALQIAEEAVLVERASGFPDDATVAAALATQIEALKAGRLEARRYDGEKSSVWSGLIRRKWMAPRGKLLSAIETAEKSANARDDGG